MDPILCLSMRKILEHDALQHELLVLHLSPGLNMQVKTYLVPLHNLLQVPNHNRLSQYNWRPWRHLKSYPPCRWMDTSLQGGQLFLKCSTVSFRLALWYSTLLFISFNQSSLRDQIFSKPLNKVFTELISKWSSGGCKISITGILLPRLSDTVGKCIIFP